MYGSMVEINNTVKKLVKKNKHKGNVISTFSGCGGSSLGYKAAGYNVLAAVEFIPAARDTYRANHPSTKVIDTDIRELDVHKLMESLNLQRGELDILDGSPPCSSFSNAGAKERLWGEVKKYSDTKQRTDDLFFEFMRVARILMPKVIMAENVKGLTQGKSKEVLADIMSTFDKIGYVPTWKILRGCDYGAPQLRPRIIFVCIRKDIYKEEFVYPEHTHHPDRFVTVKRALRNVDNDKDEVEMLLDAGSRYAAMKDFYHEIPNPGACHVKRFSLCRNHWDKPSFTITAKTGDKSSASVVHPFEKRKHTVAECKRLMGFPDDFKLTGDWSRQIERLGRSVNPQIITATAEKVYEDILSKNKDKVYRPFINWSNVARPKRKKKIKKRK